MPDDVRVLVQNCLNGEVTPNMRHVCFGYDGSRARLVFYMAAEPTEDDRECGEIVAVEFDASLDHPLDAFDVDFVVTDEPIGRLDTLDALLFSRWERG